MRTVHGLPIFDSHLHIIDPRFALIANNGYLPPPFGCDDYRQQTRDLAIVGGAVVSGSFQGFDQDYLLAALGELGEGFVGVTQLPASASDATVLRLHRAGVRAVRFNLKRGGSERVEHLDRLARRVYELAGWHVELYVDASQLQSLAPTLLALPAVSIDHLGLSQAGWRDLLRLVEGGVKVKATGFSRGDLDITAAVRQISRIDPAALMFGTDLPCTRAPRPFGDADIDTLYQALDDELRPGVFADNARKFYRLDTSDSPPAPATR